MGCHEDLYDLIGGDYNVTRKADPHICQRLLTLLCPEKGRSFIDIGCGTGNYTIALTQHGFQFVGIDPSEAMLVIARDREPLNYWLAGSAEKIPPPDK